MQANKLNGLTSWISMTFAGAGGWVQTMLESCGTHAMKKRYFNPQEVLAGLGISSPIEFHDTARCVPFELHPNLCRSCCSKSCARGTNTSDNRSGLGSISSPIQPNLFAFKPQAGAPLQDLLQRLPTEQDVPAMCLISRFKPSKPPLQNPQT